MSGLLKFGSRYKCRLHRIHMVKMSNRYFLNSLNAVQDKRLQIYLQSAADVVAFVQEEVIEESITEVKQCSFKFWLAYDSEKMKYTIVNNVFK